jgi:lysophospholipase L1-like esterase
LGNSVTTLQNDVTTLQHAYAGAKAAATVADMTDHNQIYVYVGSETGYTNGNWYYWNGTAWTSGGVYNATALETDTTLTVSGAAADAKTVGDELKNINNSAIQKYPISISKAYLDSNPQYDTFLKLPKNRIYMIINDVPESFGLPKKMHGTLLVYCPKNSDSTSTGYTVYRYNVDHHEYYGFALEDTTLSSFKWISQQFSSFTTVTSNILNLEVNKSYTVDATSNYGKFGLPVNGPGTLNIFRPSEDKSTGFRVYEYFVRDEIYMALCYENETIDSIPWKKLVFDDGKIVKVLGKGATSANYGNVILVPNNTISAVTNESDWLEFGLPRRGYGTLVKTNPYNENNEGFTNYRYSVLCAQNEAYHYFALTSINQNVEEINWQKLNNFARGLIGLGIGSKSVVFIGDSIVEGYGCSNYNGGSNGSSGHLIPNNVKTWYRNTGNKCWANMMINYIISSYPNTKACNNAIGGFTTKQIFDNLETLTIDDDGNRANIAVLSIGTNDVNNSDKWNAITIYMTKIIRWLINRGIQPVILTNSPLKIANAPAIQSAIIQACDICGVPAHDLLSRMNYYLWEHNIPLNDVMNDNLHPNDQGYEIMYNIFKKILCL